MSDIQIVTPAGLGPALFPYSQATVANGFVFLAGQVALDDDNQVVHHGDAYQQTLVVLDRMARILAEVGGTLDDIATATVFVTGLDQLPAFNRAWAERFGEHRPARAAVVAGLLLGGLVVEVQATAIARG
ncbi:RidA family protein [Nocardioides nitrophenolicus]|uniref:RidA family protein n=1 Tax=Nocardioides nitrophenolicus TaxID=60489 RepID=UPI00195A9965|nr:RidA family protein [Nocardioides nitrophenolicus]MBM7518664.1 2-iminobutanoate/2-iminopropanoate deaminase [Nocardioides nitrophenolicus]